MRLFFRFGIFGPLSPLGARLPYSQEMPTRSRNDPPNAAETGELALIRHIRSRAADRLQAGLRLGIGDDCALLRPRAGEELAVTTDLPICGTHFRLDWHPPESVGHRALARGLSDLAAMGARPVAAFLSLGLPRELARPQGRGLVDVMGGRGFLTGCWRWLTRTRRRWPAEICPNAGGAGRHCADGAVPREKRCCAPAHGPATCFM